MSQRPATDPPVPAPDPVSSFSSGVQPRLPYWLRSLGAFSVRALVVLAFLAVLLVALYAIGVVTASVVLAAVTSVAVIPLVRYLRARGWGTTKAAAAGTALVFGVLVLVVAVAAVVLVRYGPDIVAGLQAGMDDLHGREASGGVPSQIVDAIDSAVNSAKAWLGANAGAIANDVSNLVSVLLFGAFTTFFVLSNDLAWWRWLTQDLDTGGRTAAAAVAEAGEGRLGSYLRFIAVMAVAEALVNLVLLAALGVPNAIALATLVFAAAFVPYVGAVVAAIAILLVALASIGPGGTLLLAVLLVVANIVLDRVVARPFDRPGARVNPAIVLIALPIGGYVAGFFGLVMAVPVAVALLAMGSALMVYLRQTSDQGSATGALVPPWLDLLAGWSWRLLAAMALVGVVFYAIVQVPMLSLPLIVAAVLAPTLAPAVGTLVHRGWGRSLASGVVTVGVAGAIVLVCGLALAALVGNVTDLSSKVGEGAGSIDDAVGGLGGLLSGLADKVTGSIGETIVSVTTSVAAFVVVLAVGVILAFIGLRDGRRTWDRLIAYMTPWRRDELNGAADRAVSVLGGYMIGTGAVAVFGAATQLVLMVILGVPLALPVFVLSVFGGYIPYIGSLLTTLLAVVLTVTTGNPVAVAVMVVFTLVFNVVQGNVIQPLVFSKMVNIHPAIVLLAIPAGGALGGILGMFLVVPIIGVVAGTWRSVLAVMGPEPPAPAATAAAQASPPGPAAASGGPAAASSPA